MKYTFNEAIFQQGNRHFIEIPFNIWKECGRKGMVSVEDYIFECSEA